jgi:hypothetical protein
MGILIKTSGEKIVVKPADGESFSLKEVQDYVGGYVEIFRVGEKKYLFNEEGLLLDLPTNTKATEELEKDCNQSVQTLVGDVLILEENEEF